MIRKSVYGFNLSRKELRELVAIKPWCNKLWKKPPIPQITAIKSKIRLQLEATQQHCSFCGLRLKGTSKGEIEHIAAKAHWRHPEFTFTLHNLTLSCHWCNFPEKKGTKETIQTKRKAYAHCKFLLVHPYFDDPNDHYEWTDNHTEILIQIKNNSPKGQFSITMFKLDTPEMNELRAAQVRHDELMAKYPIQAQDEQLINQTMDFIV